MMQSLFALPVSVLLVTIGFFIIYFSTSFGSKQSALVTALIAIFSLFLYSIFNWPGADVLAMYVAVLLVTAYMLGIISNVWEKRKAAGDSSTKWFHWGPTIIVLFFLTLFAADSVFVMVSKEGISGSLAQKLLPKKDDESAVSSKFPGVVSHNYQKKEALYNDFQEQMRLQEQRGWKVKKGWLGSAYANSTAIFQVQVTDKDDAPIIGAQISGIYMRPSDVRQDSVFSMTEKQAGIYQVELTLPEPGVWSLALTIEQGDQRHELYGRTRMESQKD